MCCKISEKLFVRYTLRVTLAQCARSAAKTTSLYRVSHAKCMYTTNISCVAKLWHASLAERRPLRPIAVHCHLPAANSQPPRRLYLRNARHRHTSGRVMHCVLCVCVLDSLSQRAMTRRINKINTRSADSPAPHEWMHKQT